jgi:hypothetical protein
MSEGENEVDLWKHCAYTSCYCEENVYNIGKYIHQNDIFPLSDCFVVFISNTSKSVCLWQQKSSSSKNAPVIWDYHVIFLLRKSTDSQFKISASSSIPNSASCITVVYDKDSSLPFPCAFDRYVEHAFRPEISLKPQFQRMFRVIPLYQYLSTFASDRSHMIDKTTDKYISPPPSYDCIASSTGETMNLPQFWNTTDENPKYGTVMNESDFVKYFLS